MTDHTEQAKRLLVHYIELLAKMAKMDWDRDNEVEVEAIVEHIIAASRETDDDQGDVWTCPHCGAERPHGAERCPQCGIPLHRLIGSTDHDGLTGHYTFTYEQLYDLLSETICLAYEYIERHGYDQRDAQGQAAQETLDGLDAERELWRAGEIKNPSQVLP